MLCFQSIRPRIVRTKAATIADYYEMDTAGGTWSLGANGISATAGTSNIAQILVGGFADQKVTADLKTATAAGSERLGVMARFRTSKSPNATYYFAQNQQGNFRITKVVDGTFTNLTSTAYTVTAGTWYTFTLQVIGSALAATITDGTTSASLTATDSAITSPGCMGFRAGPTQSTQIDCRSWQAEEM